MIEAILLTMIGTFVGWNLPQPEWAKNVQAKVLSYLKNRG